MSFKWFFVTSFLVIACASERISGPSFDQLSKVAIKRSLLVPSDKQVSAGISVNSDDQLFTDRTLYGTRKFKRESQPSYNQQSEKQDHSHSIQPHLRNSDQEADDSILIGALTGLRPPGSENSLSRGKSSGNNRDITPKPFNRVTGSFFSQTSAPFGSRTHVLHNFPNNENPKFKILEVNNRLHLNSGNQPQLNHRPHHSRPPLQRFGTTGGSTVENSLFVNGNGSPIPVSQTKFGNREGPIIVHRDENQGGPRLVHLNNRLHNRLGRVGPAPTLGTFGRFKSPRNPSPVQFSFPTNLFPVPQHHRDSIAFHSSPIASVASPSKQEANSAVDNKIDNVDHKSEDTQDRFKLAGVRRVSPPPRISRHSPKPQSNVHRNRLNNQPIRINNPGLQPFFFHVDNHNSAKRVKSPTSGAVASSSIRRPQFVQEQISPPREYSYGYAVDDRITGDQKKVYESQGLDGVVRGQYSLVQPDGLYRVVTYTADKENGFQANVEYLPVSGLRSG